MVQLVPGFEVTVADKASTIKSHLRILSLRDRIWVVAWQDYQADAVATTIRARYRVFRQASSVIPPSLPRSDLHKTSSVILHWLSWGMGF